MPDELSDADISAIEERLAAAVAVAPPPWEAFLETRSATGGASFVRCGGPSGRDNEIYLELHLGDQHRVSPDARLDPLLDLLGHAPADIHRLLNEVRRRRRDPE